MLNRNIPKSYFKTLNEKDYYIEEKEHWINLKDNSHYVNYDEFLFTPTYKQYIRNRLKLLLKQVNLPKKENLKIMDICSGVGNVGLNIYDLLGSKNIDFIDLSKEQIKICKKKACELVKENNFNYLVEDIGKLKGKKYDIIIGNSFIHHFPDILKYLKIIYNLLDKNGGFINLHEPSVTAMYTESFPLTIGITHFIKKLLNKNYQKTFTTTDLWTFTEEDLKRLYKKAGFKEVYIIKNGFLSTLLVNPLLTLGGRKNKKIKAILYTIKTYLEKVDYYLQQILPSRLFSSFLILAKK